MNSIVFWPCVIGLVPVLLARTWPARRVAILFGAVCIGLGLYQLRVNHEYPPPSELRRFVIPVFGTLITAFVSVIVTYRLDRKHVT